MIDRLCRDHKGMNAGFAVSIALCFARMVQVLSERKYLYFRDLRHHLTKVLAYHASVR